MTSRETNAEPVASTATLGEDGTVRADSRRRLLRRRLSRIRVGIGFLLLSAALLLAGIRLSLPAVENYRSEVQQWVSQILGRALTIDALSAYWRGWTPVLDMQGVRLLRADSIGARGESALTFERVRISIDPVASFASRAIVPNSIVLGGASFAIKYAADGSLRIAGMRTAGPGGDAGVTEDVARWLLRDGRLIFDSATVSWTDEEGRGTPLLLTNVRVQLLNRGEDHQLTGSFRLPGVSQDRIELALAARGDLLTSGWDGELLLSGNGVDVFPLVQIYRPIENWVTSGRADISFRGHWNNGALDRSETRIRADGLILAPGLGRLRIHEGNAEIRTGTMPTGLSADVVLTDVYTSEGRWRDTRGSINYLEGSDGVPDRLVGRFDHARLADILGLFGGETGTAAGDANPFAGYRANADLSALHFTLVPGPRMADSVSLTATFDNFSVFRSADLPSLSGFRGRVEMDGQHGVAILENGTVDVAGPDMFSGRFLVNTRGGRVAWNQDPVGPRLDVYNVEFRADGVQGQFTGSAQWDRGHDAPVVSILADVTSGDVAKLRRYIPAGVLPDGLVTWLRRSIVGGRVEQGNILVHGRMSDFPFDNATGMLEARVEIADGRLDYGDGWPALSELAGNLRFDGRDISATITGGRVFDSRIQKAEISLRELGKRTPVVSIRGEARGKAADGLKFIKESPLRPRFENQLRNITIGGDSALSLSLDLPLHSDSPARLEGKVSLNGNTIELPQLTAGLERVEGILRFTGEGVKARNVKAIYLDRTVGLEVATTGSASRYTEIRISGNADNRYVARHLVNVGVRSESGIDPTSWLARLKGEAPWLAVIQVPASRGAEHGDVLLRLESGLKGMHVDFPYPIGKATDQSGRLSLAVNISEKDRRLLRVRYGEHADATVELAKDGTGFHFRRGAVTFGGGRSRLPNGPGLYIGGHLPELVAGEWIETWRSALRPDQRSRTAPGLQRIKLAVDRLVLLGSSFGDARIDVAQASDDNWRTTLEADGLNGTVIVPRDWQNQAIVANFDRIDYRSASGPQESRQTDPRDIPSIEFTCKNLTFDDKKLGVVKLVATRVADGLDFETIYLFSDSFESKAVGSWHYGPGGHLSEFSVNVHSNSLGDFLSNLGFGNTNAEGGATDILIDANWAASPMDFNLEKLNGVLHFRSTKGRLLGIKRGTTGRIFGLLTVTTLPKRLSLDFSDLFEEGVSYDIMEGSFSLEDGQAYTNNLMMENTTARVDVAGRTGLVTEDYDQVMTVTPKISSSLPLAPIWLAEKFLNRKIFDKVFSYKYTITGPWEDPKVDLQEVEAKPADRG